MTAAESTGDVTTFGLAERADLSGAISASAVELDPDQRALRAWLDEYLRKPNTLRAYAREARRFWLWWSTVRNGRSLRHFGRIELDAFVAVLAAPPSEWTSSADNVGWRPFKGPLSLASRRQALVILQSLFEYLVQAGHLKANPVRLVRDKGPTPQRATRHVPSEAAMSRVGHWLSACTATNAESNPAGGGPSARDAFVWQWLYWTGARRCELVHAELLNNAGKERWWWTVLGKGEQSARIPLNVEAVDVLARFLNCAARDLGDVIRSNPHRALVPASRGAPRGVAVSQIYESVCRVAIAASENAASIGLDANESAMIGATRPHGLRAYRATHLFSLQPRRGVPCHRELRPDLTSQRPEGPRRRQTDRGRPVSTPAPSGRATCLRVRQCRSLQT